MKSHDKLLDIDKLIGKIIEESYARGHKADDNGAMFAKQRQNNSYAHGHSNEKSQPNQGKKITCNYCGKVGHKASKCFKRKNKEKDKAGAVEDIFFASDIFSCDDSSYNATTVGEWCIDSGCTTHLCKDKSLFVESREMKSGVKLASNTTAEVTAKGNVRIVASDGKRDKSFLFENTLFVPSLRSNLLLVAKIVDKGHTIIFSNTGASVKDQRGNTRLTAKREGNLFIVHTKSEIANAVSSKNNDSMEWHKRLGHLNRTDMKLMVENKLITGIDCDFKLDSSPCETCAAGKITRLPFPKESQRSSSVLEIIHTDLCGPMRTTSLGGARYLLTFTDDYTRWTEVFFLSSKSEVASKFKEFAETHTGAKIKTIQSDNGKEFVNTGMHRILRDAGIRNRLTAPYTPQQNGVSERKNRTLIESARCLLIDSKLPKTFWGEAVSTACYLRNRCPTKSLEFGTPHEKWIGKRPDLRHLRKFGLKVYCLDKRPHKDKLEPRGIEGIFIGYATNAKAYRVWVPSERKVRITRDVRFMSQYWKNDQENPSATCDVEFILNPRGNQNLHNDELIIPDPHEEMEHFSEGEENPGEEMEEPVVRLEGAGVQENDPGENSRRGVGRPKKNRTGKRGRPGKVYNMINSNPAIPDHHPPATNSDDDSSEEEFYGWDYDENITMNACEISLKDALSRPEGNKWEDAIYAEIRSLVLMDTFDLVDKPKDEKVIKCRTVLRNKFGAGGNLERRKARVVAKGYAQQPGVHFSETFAPVARLSSLRLLIALAVKFDLEITQLDIETAYLNAEMDTLVYMEQPDLLKKMLEKMTHEEDSNLSRKARNMLRKYNGKTKVCKLNRAIYGLRQAGRQWHAKLDSVLRKMNLTPTNADPCVYMDETNTTILLIYVDDILIISNNRARESSIKKRLSEMFKIKDLGEAKFILGLEITRDQTGVTLSQSTYIQDILQRFRMEDCKPVGTPLAADHKLTKSSSDPSPADAFPYRELIGALTYAALGTRPDISHAVSVLSQFSSNPLQEHWTAAKRVLRYLKGTADLGLKFTKDDNSLKCFVDADWANCPIDRRSFTGSVFVLSGAAISWESRKQRTVALSSTEAEYMAITDASKEALHLISFLKELRFPDLAKVTIFNDNQGAGKLAENPVHHSRSKHIDVRHHFIRQVLKWYPVDLVYMPTERMPADVLTKGLPGPKHLDCILGLGMSSIKSSPVST